ncbi:uncharacterized protein EV420DRAFT_1483254 [Desarmillaria tabescens]|uniref:Uncharacterized protein n=1 Tax=Armillaria tabescens TaxID=1929756 RepID=A0AA39MX45_ARMTA|nr:uncharacterized protein EV420DRAFT_1483254 [Desarmillaria tabescens]KAK0449060.1 hypothetical protein EV420DRAFT_1483254 [Desarmillaria tabescens]
MTTINFSLLWFFVRFGFIDNGQDALSVFMGLTSFNSQWTITQVGMGVTGTISTIISDGTLEELRQVVVESAALYSAALIIYITFISHNTLGTYLDVIMSSIKGISPTLIVGRVTTGQRL